MKRFLFFASIVLFFTTTGSAQNNVAINDNGSSPDPSAVLDVNSSSKGLLIPRVSLLSSTDVVTIASPASSLLLYNTATIADLTPGYYFWDGTSKWVRLLAGADPNHKLNITHKSATATLLKTENMVLASGDITLTLPTVTSDDDGLEITVKNTGTYTDLITILPQTGKTIDADANSTLTRWRSRTFVATGTNWVIKEKETRTDNLIDISATGSFVTISEALGFLNEHMGMPTVIRLGGGTHQIGATQTVNLPYPVTFEGLSFGETFIVGTAGVSGSNLFVCQSECYFKMLNFTGYATATGNNAIDFTGTGTYYEVKDCNFDGFNKGIVTSNNTELWVFENDFNNCPGAGIEISAGSASGGSLKVSECDFIQCAKGIHLLSGVSETISILNCTFYNTASGSDIGIFYEPATFTNFSSMFISNTAWNNQGTYISGFDFSRSDGRDANAFLMNNAGMENENPHCKINVNNNNSTTTITNNGTYYKATWTTTSSYTCKWTLLNNKITYQPNNGRDVFAIITGNISVDQSSHVITIAIVKNGVTTTRYGETDLRISTANQPYQFSTVIYVPGIAKGDYLEVFVTSSQSGDIVKFQDVQWFVNTQ
jgi:hypothetical protein